MAAKKVAKRRRHVSVASLDHIYKSQRADGTWMYEIQHPRLPDGRRPFETVCAMNEKGARARVIERRAQIFGGGIESKSKDPNETLGEAVEHWRLDCVGGLKPQSVTAYERVVRTRLQPNRLWNMKVREIDWVQVKRWLDGFQRLDGRAGEVSGGTKLQALRALNAILSHARDRGTIAVVPKLPRKHMPRQGSGRDRILTTAETETLWISFGDRSWMLPVLDVTLGLALRLGEVVGLRWEDIDFERGQATIARQVGANGTVGLPKGGAPATITLTARAEKALKTLRYETKAEGRLPVGPVFLNSLGEQRHRKDIDRAFRRAVRQAGLEDVVFHGLRHTAISRAANSGISLAHVQSFARHAKLQTTALYVHPVEDEDAVNALREAV